MAAATGENGVSGATAVAGGAQRSRGRPSRKEAEAIDRSVLEAARESFLAHGFTATTMDAIAARAGVTKATLYQRYDDKVAMLRAVLHERVAAWSAVSDRRAVNRGDTLDKRLEHYARSITRWSRDPEVRSFGELIRECWGTARAVAEEMQTIRVTRMLDVIEKDIREFGPKAGVTAANPRLIAELFLGMIGGVHRYLEDSGQADDAAIAQLCLDQAVDMFVAGKSAW